MNLNIFITSILAGMLLGSGLTGIAASLYYNQQISDLVEINQKSQRYEFEMEKASEAYRAYLMNILDEHQIEYHR